MYFCNPLVLNASYTKDLTYLNVQQRSAICLDNLHQYLITGEPILEVV